MAAQLAHTLGQRDQIREQLPEVLRELFDLSYAVQDVKIQAEGLDKKREADQRLEAETARLRASRGAAEHLAAEEEAALRSAGEIDAGNFGDVLTSLDLEDLPEVDPLIEGFLNKESVVRLYGPPKSYKSFVMLDMAGCVGAGIPWMGKRVTSGKVLYIVAEGIRGIRRRVRAWEKQNNRSMTGVDFYPKAVQLGKRNEVRALIAFARKNGYDLIIFDTQARCTVGIEENSNTDMGLVVAALDVLKEVTGACIALVHHSGADGARARGATAILGALDAEFKVEPDKDTMSVRLETVAQKDLGEHPVVEMDLVTPGPGLALAVKPRPKWYQQRAEDLPPLPTLEHTVLNVVVAFAAAGATEQMINSRTSGSTDKASVREALGQLLVKGCVARQGSTWKATSLGQRRIGGLTDDG
ncbi:AAA family ATPase [Streptomyces roseolus]|uniref:AAA family ATPase n=1 Tax=Streptomyces roseolus TaxID=67358 RepID=UPI00167B10B7|nr:AAA family ATPase [Streptomyces roseolus]